MLIKCKKCIYHIPKTKTLELSHKAKGHFGGIFGKLWITEPGFDEVRKIVKSPGKCKRYPNHIVVPANHECGEGEPIPKGVE